MSSLMGMYQIKVDTTTIANGSSIAAYLTDAAGALITSTLVGAKQSVDTLSPADHAEGVTFVAGDYGSLALGVNSSTGNYEPLQLNASNELIVAATVSFTAEHNEDAPFTNGDSGIATLLVRQDTLAVSTSADSDYGSFKSNNLGELYVFDTTTHTTLTAIKGDTASIVTNTGTIVTNTGNTATNTSTISSTLTALSKAEDAPSVSGDQGIQALAVRKDAQGSNVNADGDYASLIVWSEGSLKVVDVANGTILQQQVSITNTAAQVPAANLANRKTLMLQNTGANKLFIGSSTVTSSGATTGIELPANSFMELECGPAVNVYAVKVGATGNTLNVLEMA